MCSVTWNNAVRLVFCGSRDVGSACIPILRMPPRFGWPAAAAGAVVGLAAAAAVGAAAAGAAGVGCVAAAGAVVGLAAGTAVGAGGAVVGATGVVAGPHAARKKVAAIRKRSMESPRR